MCDKADHLAKDYSRHIFRLTPILVVRGRASTKAIQERGSGTCGGYYWPTL